jgi:hypothetical protein
LRRVKIYPPFHPYSSTPRRSPRSNQSYVSFNTSAAAVESCSILLVRSLLLEKGPLCCCSSGDRQLHTCWKCCLPSNSIRLLMSGKMANQGVPRSSPRHQSTLNSRSITGRRVAVLRIAAFCLVFLQCGHQRSFLVCYAIDCRIEIVITGGACSKPVLYLHYWRRSSGRTPSFFDACQFCSLGCEGERFCATWRAVLAVPEQNGHHCGPFLLIIFKQRIEIIDCSHRKLNQYFLCSLMPTSGIHVRSLMDARIWRCAANVFA